MSSFDVGSYAVVGPAAHIQVGGFFNRSVGVVADIAVSGATITATALGGPVIHQGDTVTRHSLGLEAQVFPLAFGRLHAGAFAKGGVTFLGGPEGVETGPSGGGGALFEIELTARLALTFRAAATAAHVAGGWSTAGTLTGGVAVY